MSIVLENKVLTNNWTYRELSLKDDRYIVGASKVGNVRKIVLTNLAENYEEILTEETIISRCEEWNPAFSDYNFADIVDSLLFNIPKYATTVSDFKKIELKCSIDDAFFVFHINMIECTSENFSKNYINIMHKSFFELHHRYNHLLDLVQKKDLELDEYKAQGKEILRKSLITKKFEESLFESDLKNHKTFDKINVFLESMKFYESMKNIQQSDSTTCTKENLECKQKTVTSKNKRDELLRCALPEKPRKKIKTPKQNADFKFL